MNCAGTYQPSKTINPYEELSRQIDLQISIPELQTALTGIMVQSAKTGEILYQHNGYKLFMPASNEKIPTSAAALINFGPDFRYETIISTNGEIIDSTLKGDLTIRGSGDPTLSDRFQANKDSFFIFEAWADSLKAKGINKIEGNIIGIDNVFDEQAIGYGWTVDNLSYYYAAQIGGLIYNENTATIVIESDSQGVNIDYKIIPDFGYLQIRSELEFDAEETDIYVERITGTNIILIKGKIQSEKRYKEYVSIDNPTLYFLNGLNYELNALGIKTSGKIIDADNLTDSLNTSQTERLFTCSSIPFKDVLNVLMKKSQNLYAESMVKLLGHHFGKEGSFDEGSNVIKQTLERFGLEQDSYSFMDGSGLCRYNYISPYHLVQILRGMHYHPYDKVFKESLPIAGIDGTIGYRMKGTAAQGNVFAKTGTISNVRCLSGYATSADGETLIFSTMFNNFLCSVRTVMDVQDRICTLLSSFSRDKNRMQNKR